MKACSILRLQKSTNRYSRQPWLQFFNQSSRIPQMAFTVWMYCASRISLNSPRISKGVDPAFVVGAKTVSNSTVRITAKLTQDSIDVMPTKIRRALSYHPIQRNDYIIQSPTRFSLAYLS